MKKIIICLILSQILLMVSCTSKDRVVSFDTEAVSSKNHIAFVIDPAFVVSNGTSNTTPISLGMLDSIGADILWLKPKSALDTMCDLRSFVKEAQEADMHVWVDGDFISSKQDSIDANIDAMKSAMKSLIGKADICGICFDYTLTPSLTAQFWHDIIRELKEQKPDMEFLSKADISNSANHILNPCGFDYDYASDFQQQMAQRFGRTQTQADSLRAICEQFIASSKTIQDQRMISLAPIDELLTSPAKTSKKLYGDNRYNLTVLLFTIYGIPLISHKQMEQDDLLMENTIRTLIALHHTQPDLALDAPITFLPTSDPQVLAYQRGSVVVVLNLGNDEAHVNVIDLEAGEYDQWLDSKTLKDGYSVQSIELSSSQSIALDAHGFAVYVACDKKSN